MNPSPEHVLIIGAGPAGLMAAEVLGTAGWSVDICDAMPSPARKFLRAGIGGLNLTHAEPATDFLARYGARAAEVAPWLWGFAADAVREWANGLGVATFVGSSGRVFPVGMKAAPLLRAWLRRLADLGVRIHPRHRWLGWDDDGALRFATPAGEVKVSLGGTADSAPVPLLLALGGGSWRRLGSDGAWMPLLAAHGVEVAPLRPANCGFDVAWSTHLRERFAGTPLKAVVASFGGTRRRGELMLTRHGVEGGLVYALSAALRDAIERDGTATLHLDLAPDRDEARLAAELARPRGRDSLANHLRRRAGVEGANAALLREVASPADLNDPARCAALLKALPLTLTAPRPLDEAISTAGGVRFEALDADLMLKALPGTWCAGEMIDWEAPTGGYLLTACLASGRHAARGILHRGGHADTLAPSTPAGDRP